MEGSLLDPSAWAPVEETLTRSIVSVRRSYTKTSSAPLVSPATRLVAADWNATYRPSALIAGSQERPSPCVPSDATLTRSTI